MSSLTTLSVALLSGILGLVVAGLVTATCSEWLHVSTRDGASGYLVVFVALIGGVVGLALGLGISRWVAGTQEPSFLKALGISAGAVLTLGGIGLLVGWRSTDFAPKLDGQSLELAIEVRTPKGFSLPRELDEYGAYARVSIPGSKHYEPHGDLALDSAGQEEGRWLVTAVVPLDTSSPNKSLEVRFRKEVVLSFPLPLRRHPDRRDLEWSPWADSHGDSGTFRLRYKVQHVTPPPHEPSPEELSAKKFAALKPDAPLESWLPFLYESPSDARTKVVLQRIEERQIELAALIGSTNPTVREYALGATKYPAKPAPEVVEAVRAAGREIASSLRKASALPLTDPQLLDLHTRFRQWSEAWWGLSKRLGLDSRPPVQELYNLAKSCPSGTAMDALVADVRSLLETLNKEAKAKKP